MTEQSVQTVDYCSPTAIVLYWVGLTIGSMIFMIYLILQQSLWAILLFVVSGGCLCMYSRANKCVKESVLYATGLFYVDVCVYRVVRSLLCGQVSFMRPRDDSLEGYKVS
jgi:hypothetical protein